MHKQFKRQQPEQGFTIVELLVVVVVIGILAAITVVAFNNFSGRAADAAVQTEASNAAKVLEGDFIIDGVYPETLEEANQGNGLPLNDDVSYEYSVDNTASPPTYSLVVRSERTTNRYAVSSVQPTPVAVAASLTLDFANGIYEVNGSLYTNFGTYIAETDADFSRSGAGGYDMAGTQLFANNIPRITAAGLLLEPESTNYALQSEFSFDWGTSGLSSFTPNNVVAPNGQTTAARLVENSSFAYHEVSRTIPINIATNQRVLSSVFGKRLAGDRNGSLNGFVSDFSSGYGIGTGLLNGFHGDPFAYGFFTSSVGGVAALSEGWYRPHVGATKTGTALTSLITTVQMQDLVGANEFTGNGAGSIAVWGLQVELPPASGYFSTRPSSYIPTTTTAATRGADVLSIPLPSGVNSVVVTFDDDSTQTFNGLSGTWNVPVESLNRPIVKSIVAA